jgi:hypothetical protein
LVNFLFYVGNARAGSTWLHGELNARGDCEFSHIKEHFIFQNFSFFPDFDKNSYFDFYQSLIKDETKLLGDMTPSNAYARREQLLWFKNNMAKRDITVLPMMTLRDPIEQIVSVTKLNKTVMDSDPDFSHPTTIVNLLKNPTNRIDITVKDIMSVGRPSFREYLVPWETTIKNCEKVFGKIHINLYETFFTEKSMSDMFDYLQIPSSSMKLSNKVFSFGSDNPLTEDEKQFVYENYPFYKENYAFAIERFGKEFIESIWWTPNK